VPLMIDRSSQAEWLKPIVVSLAYGLVVAFFVTLFLVPALLIIGNKFTRRRRAAFASLKKRVTGVPATDSGVGH
jgi:predicted RND superfamily exporter protein